MEIVLNEHVVRLLVERKKMLELPYSEVDEKWQGRFDEVCGDIARWVCVEYFYRLEKEGI